MAKSRKVSFKLLRSAHWYELACLESGLDNTGLNCYPGDRVNGNLAADWENRKSIVQARSVNRLRGAAPIGAFVYDNAPYELLADSSLSLARLDFLMGQGTDDEFPLREELSGQAVLGNVDSVDCWMLDLSSEELVQRGDLLAFFTILARVRKAESQNNPTNHILEISNLYRCMAGLGRFEWLRRDFGLLCDLVETIHHRVTLTRDYVGVDWDVLMTQFNDPNFEPDPTARRKDPQTGTPIAISDPVEFAKAISRGERPRLSDGDQPKRNSTPFDGGYFKDLSYRQVCRMHSDQLLFTSFMQTAHLWGVLRSDWEAVLGVSSSQMKRWSTIGLLNLTKIARHRILTINVVREWLSQDSDYRKHCANSVKKSRDDLGGRSVCQVLRSGGAMELLEIIPADPATTDRKRTLSTVLPLASIPR